MIFQAHPKGAPICESCGSEQVRVWFDGRDRAVGNCCIFEARDAAVRLVSIEDAAVERRLSTYLSPTAAHLRHRTQHRDIYFSACEFCRAEDADRLAGDEAA